MATEVETSFRNRQLVLKNTLSELERLNAFAHEIGDGERLDADRVFALQLCLEEAVANIIMHGGSRADKEITVTLIRGAPAMEIRVEDNGAPFDPTKVPPPPAPTSLDDAQIGGQGIPLIRRLASEMRYEHASGQNRLTLVFAPRT